MKLKKVLCMAALSAAVALSGIPAVGAVVPVQAEESQTAGLDEILKQMYVCYQNGDTASMIMLDNAAQNYVSLVAATGADRYVLDIDGNTKAMLYISPNGGWWWYFGQMENNLRQGNGTTVIVGSEYSEVFTGTYAADFPSGNGAYSIHWYNTGSGYDILGSFQGTQLNGTYQVNTTWVDEGAAYASSLPISYTNSIMTAVGGWECEVWADEDYTTYIFYNDSADDVWFDVDTGYSLAAVGMTPDGYSGHWWGKGDVSERFSSVFYGNAAASAYVSTAAPAPAPVVPETPAPVAPETPAPVVPETPAAPQPEVVAPAPAVSASGTYTVVRGDNLSKIAEKVYGDRTQWKKIYDANSDVIKSDYIIWANQVLVIPAL